MRQCMIRQVLHFIEHVKELRDRFCADCADANDRGLEQNLLRKSPFLSGASGNSNHASENASAIARRHAEMNGSRVRGSARYIIRGAAAGVASTTARELRGSSAAAGGAGGGNEDYGIGQQWDNDDGIDLKENTDEFALDGPGSGGIGGDEDDEEEGGGGGWMEEDDEEYGGENDPLEGGRGDLNFLDSALGAGAGAGGGGNNPARRKTLSFASELGPEAGGGDEAAVARGFAQRRGSRSKDTNSSVLLCAIVRQAFVEDLVDWLANWFPCLFK
jgi:hypothetical protein